MDPALAAAMPSDAAFAAMRQQQAAAAAGLNLGPQQQAWLQQHQQQQAAAAAAAGLGGDGMSALLAHQQQQQWQGMLQQGLHGGYPSLMGPSLYGLDGLQGHGGDGRGLGAGAAAAGLSGVAGLSGMLSAPQQPLLLQQQALAYGNSPYQQPHGSMGMLAQQQLLYQQQQQLAGLQMAHQHGLNDPAAAAAAAAVAGASAWGAAGMAGLNMQQQGLHVGSSAALDPPVLELPNLSPIKTGAQAGAAGANKAQGTLAAAAAAAAAATAAGGPAASGALAASAAGLGVLGAGGAAAAAAAAAAGRRGSQGAVGMQQQGGRGRGQPHPLELPGSLAELGGGAEDEAIAMSPFGQLGLNAADVDALLSGFEPSNTNMLAQNDEAAAGGANGGFRVQDLWGNLRSS